MQCGGVVFNGVLNRLNSMAWDEQAAKHTLWLLDKQEAASGTSSV